MSVAAGGHPTAQKFALCPEREDDGEHGRSRGRSQGRRRRTISTDREAEKACPYVEELCKVRGARFAGKSSAT